MGGSSIVRIGRSETGATATSSVVVAIVRFQGAATATSTADIGRIAARLLLKGRKRTASLRSTE